MNYLHNEMDYVHRDLKPANILLDENAVPKVIIMLLLLLYSDDLLMNWKDYRLWYFKGHELRCH